MRYTSHKAVFTILPKLLLELNSSLLDNYIIQCIRQIDATPMYENKIAMMKVTNGVASLPDDFIRAYGVFYNSADPTEDELNSLMGCLDHDTLDAAGCITDAPLSDSSTTTSETDTISTDTPLTLQDRYKLVKVATTASDGVTTTGYIMKGVVYNNYLSSSYMLNCWTPLKMSDKLFTQCFMEKKSPCSNTECDYRYSFDRCGHILTSLADGWLKVAYTGRPTNADGDYLIPDDMEYMKVLKDGVLMLYFEERRVNQKQGAMNNHRDYERKFYNGVAGLRGSSLLPKGAIKDKQLRNIIYEKIRIANDYSLTGNSGWTGHTLYKNMR